MTGLDEAYDSECVEFFSLSSLWRELAGHQVISGPTVVKGRYFCCRPHVCVNRKRMTRLSFEYVAVNLGQVWVDRFAVNIMACRWFKRLAVNA